MSMGWFFTCWEKEFRVWLSEIIMCKWIWFDENNRSDLRRIDDWLIQCQLLFKISARWEIGFNDEEEEISFEKYLVKISWDLPQFVNEKFCKLVFIRVKRDVRRSDWNFHWSITW